MTSPAASLIDETLAHEVSKLQAKYAAEGQNIVCHLEKLLYEKNLDYADYLCTDILLNIQRPKTNFPDEIVFIIFHQIAELYFRMILWEIEQLTSPPQAGEAVFLEKVQRLNRYYKNLIHSFDIMSDGLDRAQFQTFRKALFPASGFQSVQYRLIEICSTDALNLVVCEHRQAAAGGKTAELYRHIYWKSGATEVGTGRKDLSLVHFEQRYDAYLAGKLKEYQHKNLWQTFVQFYSQAPAREKITEALRTFDHLSNVGWSTVHLRAAARHLVKPEGETVPSTGGTNWRKYLTPRHQRIMFFPELWTEAERMNWGKTE